MIYKTKTCMNLRMQIEDISILSNFKNSTNLLLDNFNVIDNYKFENQEKIKFRENISTFALTIYELLDLKNIYTVLINTKNSNDKNYLKISETLNKFMTSMNNCNLFLSSVSEINSGLGEAQKPNSEINVNVKVEINGHQIFISDFLKNYLKIFYMTLEFLTTLENNKNCFVNTITIDKNIEDYNQKISHLQKIIDDENSKINMIKERLCENNCCPICYVSVEQNEFNYVTQCCFNKICVACVNNWYDTMKKTTCLYCNMPGKNKDSLLKLKNEESVKLIEDAKANLKVAATEEGDENDIDENIEISQDSEESQYVKIHEEIDINKIEYITKYINDLSKNKKKTMIFSDYTNVFKQIMFLCEKLNVKSIDLDKGNIKEIDEAVDNYKNKDTQVLLCNSELFGHGMNFENTDEIVFIHKMRPELEKQIIGRAQRTGRKNQLIVNYLYYQNEHEFAMNIKKAGYTLRNVTVMAGTIDFYD